MDRIRLLGALSTCTLLACGSNAADNAVLLSAAAKSESAIERGGASADSGLPDDPGETCFQEIDTERTLPTVWLVVDGSGSMAESLSASDATSRWDALRGALLDDEAGALKGLANEARVGLLMYDGPLPGGDATTPSGPAATCPRLVTVDPALDNLAALEAAYTAAPLGGSTPTDKALDALLERADGPAIVILATDGQPNDFCSNDPALDVRGRVVDDAKKLAEKRASLYVISLAGADAALTQHLNDVAAASGTGKPLFTPQTSEELASTLAELTRLERFCDVELSGPISRRHSRRVTVEVNGERIARNDPNGWRLRGSTTIEITGETCDGIRRDGHAKIHVGYPCEGEQP